MGGSFTRAGLLTDQEIQFMLKILGDTKLDMPVVLDWEIPANTARTRNIL